MGADWGPIGGRLGADWGPEKFWVDIYTQIARATRTYQQRPQRGSRRRSGHENDRSGSGGRSSRSCISTVLRSWCGTCQVAFCVERVVRRLSGAGRLPAGLRLRRALPSHWFRRVAGCFRKDGSAASGPSAPPAAPWGHRSAVLRGSRSPGLVMRLLLQQRSQRPAPATGKCQERSKMMTFQIL